MEYIFILNEAYYRASAITQITPNTVSMRGGGFDLYVGTVPVFVRMGTHDQDRVIRLIAEMMLGLPLVTVPPDAVFTDGNKAVVDLDWFLKPTVTEVNDAF